VNSNFQATYAAFRKPSRVVELTTIAGEPPPAIPDRIPKEKFWDLGLSFFLKGEETRTFRARAHNDLRARRHVGALLFTDLAPLRKPVQLGGALKRPARA
jgi:hypothetical protein